MSLAAALLAACGGGSGSGTTSPGVLSGRVTYDLVPVVGTGGSGHLDYAATRALPVRGAVVEAFDSSGVLVSGTTDASGRYSLAVPAGRQVAVRVQASLVRSSQGGAWSVAVRDNTSPSYRTDPAQTPIYALTSQPLTVPDQGASLDLHAASGWSNGQYGSVRPAAPFSILDQAYGAMQHFLAVAPDIDFPHLNIYWSVDNQPASGDIADGDIGTSHWNTTPNEGLFILGKADVDTDEYDTAVLVHEWGHYFESKLSRADSIGGEHSHGDKLDMRVAWGEGWGNGLAGMVRGDPAYVDTSGPGQRQGFGFMVDALPVDQDDRAWYSESSIQYFLYQLSQEPGGFAGTVSVLRNEQRLTPALTSIFSFGSALHGGRFLATDATARVNTMLASLNTPALDQLTPWGGPATYTVPVTPGVPQPVYLAVNDTPREVCVSNLFGGPNKLDQGRFLRVDVAAAGRYRVQMTRLSPSGFSSEGGVLLYRLGVMQNAVASGTGTEDYQLEAGTYVAVFMDSALVGGTAPAGSRACYDVSVKLVTNATGVVP